MADHLIDYPCFNWYCDRIKKKLQMELIYWMNTIVFAYRWILLLHIWQGVLDTTSCDKVCRWLAAGWWLSLVYSTNNTGWHDITETLLKLAFNTITTPHNHPFKKYLKLARDKLESLTVDFTVEKMNEFEWIWNWILVFNVTFSNISAISWRPVLVVEEAGVPGENHWLWASNL